MKESIKAEAIKILNSTTCEWTIQDRIKHAENKIELLEAIISILMEREAEQEAMESISSCYAEVPCRLVRKIVAVMANKLRKTGHSLSAAFKRAWEFVKFCVTHKHLVEKIVI